MEGMLASQTTWSGGFAWVRLAWERWGRTRKRLTASLERSIRKNKTDPGGVNLGKAWRGEEHVVVWNV